MSDPNIIYSGLGDHITVDGQTFKVEIYRLENNHDWILEVIDQDGTSIVWDNPFPSDKAALDELQAVIKAEGANAFTGGNIIPFPKS